MPNRLFFAVKPDAGASALVRAAMRRCIARQWLSGRQVDPVRHHVTLHWLGDHEEIAPDLLSRAKEAGGLVEMAPVEVGFDRIGSLHPDTPGLALTGSAELQGLRQLQRRLAQALDEVGLGHCIRKRFYPHISLLYGGQQVAGEQIQPVRWRLEELVLINSLVGDGEHVVLDRWKLQDRQMSLGDW